MLTEGGEMSLCDDMENPEKSYAYFIHVFQASQSTISQLFAVNVETFHKTGSSMVLKHYTRGIQVELVWLSISKVKMT